jgi:spermidine/putrescine transport system substrate-binding protein
MNTPRPSDPAFLRGLTSRSLSRRDALRISGISAAALALAACGVKGQGSTAAPTTPAADAVAKFWAGKKKSGKLDFANWPLYMDPQKPQLAEFTKQTGITVNYQEVIQEMGPWFAKVQPQLAAGQSIGFDLMVITNGIQFKQFVQSKFLAPLDHSKLTNFTAHAGAAYKKTSYDAGNVYSAPWASGMTGIAYDPDKVKDPITKLADLWNPAYKGKVGMFSDTQELANFGLLALGIDPAKSTKADWQKAADKLKQQKDAGIVRKYYDQSYVDALGSGEVWITQAWSGDILQKNASDGTNFQFVIPQEGGTIWTDNFAIPITAPNPVDAIMAIDFFYRPEIASTLAEFIGYVTPVPEAQPLMQKDADADTTDNKAYLDSVAKSPLVFPDAATYAKLHYYVDFPDAATQQQFQTIFEPLVLS